MSAEDVRDGRKRQMEAEHSAPSEILRELGDAGRRAEGTAFRTALKLAIEREVIPKLIIADAAISAPASSTVSLHRAVTSVEVSTFQDFLLGGTLDECSTYMETLRQSGVLPRSIYSDLFALVARQLGREWDSDDLSFVDVSIAMGRLQSLLERLSVERRHIANRQVDLSILLAASPGDQHALGLSIVAECFRTAGWHVAGGASLTTGHDLATIVHDEWFSVVGLSASTEEKAQLLVSDIKILRQISRNRRIVVLVGGHGFASHPEISCMIGADGLAADGASAVDEAERLTVR